MRVCTSCNFRHFVGCVRAHGKHAQQRFFRCQTAAWATRPPQYVQEDEGAGREQPSCLGGVKSQSCRVQRCQMGLPRKLFGHRRSPPAMAGAGGMQKQAAVLGSHNAETVQFLPSSRLQTERQLFRQALTRSMLAAPTAFAVSVLLSQQIQFGKLLVPDRRLQECALVARNESQAVQG